MMFLFLIPIFISGLTSDYIDKQERKKALESDVHIQYQIQKGIEKRFKIMVGIQIITFIALCVFVFMA